MEHLPFQVEVEERLAEVAGDRLARLLLQQQHIAGPDNDLRPGHRRYNVVWYRPADEHGELQRLLTDESGTTHAISIPPPLIARAAVKEMRADAMRLVAPQFREIVRLMDEPILQPIYDLETPRMAFGRVAIIGDAASLGKLFIKP